MRQYYLADITTKDKISLQGIYAEPKMNGRRALLLEHGLSGTFYRDSKMLETFADASNKEGWGFAAFNNRGHDMLAGMRKMDGTPPYGYSFYPAGAGREVFEESVLDIDAGVDFLMKQGYSEVILMGHSTGANKACYYAATQKNPHIVGVVLAGPMSDRLSMAKTDKNILKNVSAMHNYIDEGRGDELMLGYHFFPITPKRYVSLFEPKSPEDVFDIAEPEPKLVTFSNIQLPMLVVLLGNDEAADRPMEEIKKTFDSHAKSPKYTSVIIPAALHRFNGHEQEVVDTIIHWAKTI